MGLNGKNILQFKIIFLYLYQNKEMNYLKPDKIRIGNIIASGANVENQETWVYGKVVSISSVETDFEQVYVETPEEFGWFFKGNYFSIPLTKDWLKKFGFEINRTTKEENNIWRKKFTEGNFELEEIKNFFFGHPLHSVEINGVEHLQNLYFFITGEELETENLI